MTSDHAAAQAERDALRRVAFAASVAVCNARRTPDPDGYVAIPGPAYNALHRAVGRLQYVCPDYFPSCIKAAYAAGRAVH